MLVLVMSVTQNCFKGPSLHFCSDMFCLSFSFIFALFFLQAGKLTLPFFFQGSFSHYCVTETDENIEKSMFINQEDVVVDEAELALLASVPAQHLPLSQTATDLGFLLRLMLQSDILIGDNLAGKQNQT